MTARRPVAVCLAAFALGLAVGCSGPPAAPEARPSLVGAWQSLDTLVFELPADPDLGDGAEPSVYRLLWSHLSITDSLWTETAVAETPGGLSGSGLDAYEQSRGYSTAGDSLFLSSGDAPLALHAVVQGDTLVLQLPAPMRRRARYVRSRSLATDATLVGAWSGFTEPDAAGVPAEVGFLFSADGTYQNGWGAPQGRFARAGPYLLLEDREMTEAFADVNPAGVGYTAFNAVLVEIQAREAAPDVLVLGPTDGENGPLVLYRR